MTDWIRARLFEVRDDKYRTFMTKLIPTVAPARILGVRAPQLRALGKELAKSPDADAFLAELPHGYYEEDNLHAFVIGGMRDFGQTIAALNQFLPYVDNWATCDSMTPKVFKKHLPELLEHIRAWIASDKTYTVRFAIGMLMAFYLDDAFDPAYLDMVACVRSEEYYVNMMIAWYFATALAKQYDCAVAYIEQSKLDRWTHNKTIQKAVESYRVTDAQKAYLRTLRRRA